MAASNYRESHFMNVDMDSKLLIARYLHPLDAASLAATCRHWQYVCVRVHGPGILQVISHINRYYQTATGPANTMAANYIAAATSSLASTLMSSGTADDSLATTDTELTSSDDDDEWEFHITPDILHRLNNLPERISGNQLPTLPTELQLQIFSYLDQIDSCCLGLTSRTSYLIFRSIFGIKMPLNTRRQGPNLLERAWELVGKQECDQCGIYRCELHQHIKTWMPAELEYCSMKRTFGLPSRDEAKPNCYRGKPSKPRRCRRHPERTTTVCESDVKAL